MPNPELTSPSFQREIVYARPELIPSSVTTSTSAVIGKYFRREIEGQENKGIAIRVLQGASAFVRNAQIGLRDYPQIVDRTRVASVKDLLNLMKIEGQPSVPVSEEQEAVRFSLLTMGEMPRLARWYGLDVEGGVQEYSFSRRGMLECPATIREAQYRLNEVWVGLGGITSRLADPEKEQNRPIRLDTDRIAIRTKLFFDVGSQINVAA